MFTGSLPQCSEVVYDVCLKGCVSIAALLVDKDKSTNIVTDGFIHTIHMRVEVMNQRFITDVWNAKFAAEAVVFMQKVAKALVCDI